MPRAVKPNDITSFEKAVMAIKNKAINVSIDLDTGDFVVKDAKDNIVKRFRAKKGSDAIYVVNKTEHADDLQAASQYMLNQRTQLAENASEFETKFAEKQKSLLQTVEMWRGVTPGASRDALSLQIGRIQTELATLERQLRSKQYKYREALEVAGIKRRIYIPASNDERVVPHLVYKLNATQTSVINRILPIKEEETV